jgi:hypothetical protein
MERTYQANVIWKALAFWGVFMTLYALYKFFPVFPLSLICGVTESNFQHYKAGFFSYLIVNLVEYAWNRQRIADRVRFLYSRLTATIFLPWIIFLLWYVAPAVIGRWPNNTHEILYANVITFLVGVCTVILERGLQSAAYPRSLKVMLFILFGVSILLYIVFTFRLPWADVFVEPDWR